MKSGGASAPSARNFLKDAAGLKFGWGTSASYFPEQWGGLKREIEKLKSRFAPDLIFTHYREDRHQDHRTISELTWNTFRNHLILEYEVPKYDGDLGQPNLYVPLDAALCARKTDALLKHFPSQTTKHWFRRNTFEAIARIRNSARQSTPKRITAAKSFFEKFGVKNV